MQYRTDDIRIKEIKELVPPSHVLREFPMSEKAAKTIFETRQAIHRILHGADDRLLVIMGPCSIHDVKAAKEYAGKLKRERDRLAGELLVVMRVYFEKPRTTVGWKGLINDPNLDGSFRINEGLRIARQLLLDLNEMGMPVGCEFLDMITPQYIADLVAWGAIGARTTESPDPPRARVRPVVPGRLQERHRRQHQDRGGCDPRGAARRIISCRSPRPATAQSSPPPATRTATSSCAAAAKPNYDAASVDAAAQGPGRRPACRRGS